MIIHCQYDKLLPISEIKAKFHPRNRNIHPIEQIKRLANILKYQGIRYPVKLSNRSGYMISGHGRILAAEYNGWKEFPVVIQHYDNEVQEYADLTADNAIASWSELDFAGINSDLSDLGPDLDIDMLGIKNFVVDPIEKLEPGCDEDEVPEHVEPKTKLGDTYILGNHRLLCGDSTQIDSVDKLMNGEKADMVFTDPPYGVNYDGGHATEKRRTKLANDHDTTIYNDSIPLAVAFTKDCAPLYLWFAATKSLQVLQVLQVLQDNNIEIRSWLIWNKNMAQFGAIGAQYKQKHEPCLYTFKKGNAPFWDGPTNEVSVWDISRASKNEFHPTQKPVELSERAIGNSCPVSGSVLDLFGGSGSTLIGCEKTNRKCFMMELDPHYCDVIVARWEKYTGKKAELVA